MSALDASVVDATELTVPVVINWNPPLSVTPIFLVTFDVPNIEALLKVVAETICLWMK